MHIQEFANFTFALPYKLNISLLHSPQMLNYLTFALPFTKYFTFALPYKSKLSLLHSPINRIFMNKPQFLNFDFTLQLPSSLLHSPVISRFVGYFHFCTPLYCTFALPSFSLLHSPVKPCRDQWYRAFSPLLKLCIKPIIKSHNL